MRYLYKGGPAIYESDMREFFKEKWEKRNTAPEEKVLNEQRIKFKQLYENKENNTITEIEAECNKFKDHYIKILSKIYEEVNNKLKKQYEILGFELPSSSTKSRSRSRSRSRDRFTGGAKKNNKTAKKQPKIPKDFCKKSLKFPNVKKIRNSTRKLVCYNPLFKKGCEKEFDKTFNKGYLEKCEKKMKELRKIE
jgi:hypothetical protein